MRRIILTVLAAALGTGALILLDHLGCPQGREPWCILLAYGVACFLLIFCFSPKKKSGQDRKIEYILTGSGEVTDEIFNPARHRDFELLESTSKGNCYIDSAGTLITTTFGKAAKRGANPVLLLLYCVIAAALFCCLYAAFCMQQMNSRYAGTAELGVNGIGLHAGKTSRVRFVAPEDGTYVFESSASVDLGGALYSELLSPFALAWNDDHAGSINFHLTRQMSAGDVLYIGVSGISSTASGEVDLRIAAQTGTNAAQPTQTAPSLSNVTMGSNNVAVQAGEVTRVRFTAPSAGTYIFTTAGSADTRGYLYTSETSSSYIAHSDDYDGGRAFRISYTLSANQVIYIGVSFFNGRTSGNVTLQISRESTPTATPAPRISSVNMGSSRVSVRAGEITRVSFTAPSAGTYIFTSLNSGDTRGYLYSSATSSSAIDSNDDYGGSSEFRITRTLSRNETVYVGVSYYNSSASGTVTLNISKESTPTATPAPSIATVSTGSSRVSVRAGEITRVRFTAPSAGTYIFTTTNSGDTRGYLYSSATSSSAIDSNDDYGGSSEFRITRTLSRNETVYVGVSYYNSSASGTVTLNITRQSSSSSSSGSTGSSSSRSWPVGETCRVWISNNGNARTGPGTNYAWAAYVYCGNTFEILDCQMGNTGKDWYKIRVNGQYCWVSSGLVEVDGYRNGTANRVPIP